MFGRGILVLLACSATLLALPVSSGAPDSPVLQTYRRADSLLNLPNPTDTDNKLALKGFEEVIAKLAVQPRPATDSLLFLCYRNKGILKDIDANYPAARDAYCTALRLRGLRDEPTDSLIVMTYVNVGATYYNLNQFDSASYYLLKAESLMSRFPDLEYKVRLYNTLGVLYHDNGNYLQCKNYFSQALEIIKGREPFDTISAVSVEINIATSYSRLGLYEESLDHYRKMLRYNLFGSYIYMNMGKALASLGRYNEAMVNFKKVKQEQIPWVNNEMGHAQTELGHYDSAQYFLDRVKDPAWYARLSLADRGINKLYRSELLVKQQQLMPALDSLQAAITCFAGNFKDKNVYANPSGFAGSFAYYRLFTALSKKAALFEKLYTQTNKGEWLVAAMDTYDATLSLLDYIEKSYDTDDAKLLLKKNSRPVYQSAFGVCMQLHQQYPGKHYLEKAFAINERNKASVMAASLQERSLGTAPGVKGSLLQQERNIKFNIARLVIEGDRAMSSEEADSLASRREQYEIELARVRKSLEQNSHFYQLKYAERQPSIHELQSALNSKQALVSFYATDSVLHAFVISRSGFEYKKIAGLANITENINVWLRLLKNSESGRKFTAGESGNKLYASLIQPLQACLEGKDEWIIIPDGVLYLLPFESIPVDDGFVLGTAAISYQFSSRFIIDQNIKKDGAGDGLLAFAPFSREGAEMNGMQMDRLPASGEEIRLLEGVKYFDSQATKGRFLAELNKYPVLHLATHAVADSNSASTFIAFYPAKKTAADDCLFLDELYGLNMDSTKLVIISACETGKGELVNSEGVLSLARAFVYAGCPSTVNSLWKADDRSTSAILKQFHVYLQQGMSKSKALQRAKLEYLEGNAHYGSPAHWAHLVVMGDAEAIYSRNGIYGWWSMVAIIIAGFSLLVFWKRKKSRRFP